MNTEFVSAIPFYLHEHFMTAAQKEMCEVILGRFNELIPLRIYPAVLEELLIRPVIPNSRFGLSD